MEDEIETDTDTQMTPMTSLIPTSTKPKRKSPSTTKPPTTVVSTRVDAGTRKALMAVTKKSKYKNISETLARIVEHYLVCKVKVEVANG